MPPTKFGRRYEMPLDPHYKDPAPAEFLERLALLQAVAEDAQDLNTAYGSQQANTASFGTPPDDPWGNNPQTPQTGSYDQTAPF